jgi:hypothetical protein
LIIAVGSDTPNAQIDFGWTSRVFLAKAFLEVGRKQFGRFLETAFNPCPDIGPGVHDLAVFVFCDWQTNSARFQSLYALGHDPLSSLKEKTSWIMTY